MTKLFSAVVKDKQTKETILITNKEYETKSQFIKDLKNNGYAVNPYKVKESEVFDYIINYTNCELVEWKYINKVPEEGEYVSDWIQSGLEKELKSRDIKFNKLMEECKASHEQFLVDIGMTEEEWQEYKRNK